MGSAQDGLLDGNGVETCTYTYEASVYHYLATVGQVRRPARISCRVPHCRPPARLQRWQ
jgi:hypothetical protein